MLTRARLERLLWAGVLALALLVSVDATREHWQRVGQTGPGFAVMRSGLVAVGGLDCGSLAPFDVVEAVDGRPVRSGAEVLAHVQSHPPGTVFTYRVDRAGRPVEARIASVATTARDHWRYVIEGVGPGLLFLALAAVVLAFKPGTTDARVFIVFCLASWAIPTLYSDAHWAYRYHGLFLAAFAFSPALLIHLELTFPERSAVLARAPWIPWAAYLVSAALGGALHIPPAVALDPWLLRAVPAFGAAYWVAAIVLLVLALWRTARRGSTPLTRQRARVLAIGFAAGPLVPILGTAVEAVLGIGVPYLDELWRLNLLFPLTVAYAMVRYDLFDVRTVLRTGAVYGAVTGLVVLAYGGAIAGVNLVFAGLGVGAAPLVPAVVMALAVVLFLDPVYRRTQAVVDRLFFRARHDAQAVLERVIDTLPTVLDLPRIVALLTETLDEVLRPERRALFLLDEGERVYRPALEERGAPAVLPEDAPLLAAMARRRAPISRERLAEDPDLAPVRATGLASLDAHGIELLVPVLFRTRMTAFLALGPRRSGLAYTTEDLRLLRLLANQSAVALENAKTYTALERAHAELGSALRRVQILESIRANLAKFVPRTVRDLIEAAPEAPALAKREVDVSVLFVDIAGYTRLSERFDPRRVNALVERYFGAFLDEILGHGGDVNETAGDGLMVIFQDPDPRRHARAAVAAGEGILRRAHAINQEQPDVEPIRLHVGVNSGPAAVGATKIEGTAGTRWTYTASGPVTNLAARLAAVGDGDAVILGAETRARLPDEAPVEDLGPRALRNVDGAVRVFRVPVGATGLAPAG